MNHIKILVLYLLPLSKIHVLVVVQLMHTRMRFQRCFVKFLLVKSMNKLLWFQYVQCAI